LFKIYLKKINMDNCVFDGIGLNVVNQNGLQASKAP